MSTYTRKLAEAFNAFYHECQVLDADSAAVRDARLGVTLVATHAMATAHSALDMAALLVVVAGAAPVAVNGAPPCPVPHGTGRVTPKAGQPNHPTMRRPE